MKPSSHKIKETNINENYNISNTISSGKSSTDITHSEEGDGPGILG